MRAVSGKMKNMTVRTMTPGDYTEVYALWQSVSGFGMRTVDDSEENITRFLARNEGLSVVAIEDDRIVGSILCGHDGRTAAFYHVCVHADYRGRGICGEMAGVCIEALKREKINRISLIAFTGNRVGNAYWKKQGWTMREDSNQYILDLNAENRTVFNP